MSTSSAITSEKKAQTTIRPSNNMPQSLCDTIALETLHERSKVGYNTVHMIRDMLTDYIKTHTEEGIFVGDPPYIEKYNELTKYLKK